MSTEREALAALLKDAEFFVRDYATRNPRWTDGLGHTQDPKGAHALANKLAAALAQPAQELAGAVVDPQPDELSTRILALPLPEGFAPQGFDLLARCLWNAALKAAASMVAGGKEPT